MGGHGNGAGQDGPLASLGKGQRGGCSLGALAEGFGGFGVAARFVGLCLSFPFCNHTRATHSPAPSHAQLSASVPSPRPCPLCSSVPPCLAIAPSPAWVGVTMPSPGTVPRVLQCHRAHPLSRLITAFPSSSPCPQHGSALMCPILGSVPQPILGHCPPTHPGALAPAQFGATMPGRCWFLPASSSAALELPPFLFSLPPTPFIFFFCRQLELFWLGRTAE